MLCDVGELGVLLAGSDNIETFLDRLVALVARHMSANVCSVYVLGGDDDELVLRATIGLNQEHVGRLRLKVGEGLTGLAMRELRPIVEHRASENPRFKLIEYLDDERYDAFLAVPIQRGSVRIGVLVIQRERTNSFAAPDVQALRATAAQLGGAIENARVLMDLRADEDTEAEEEALPEFLQGAPAVEGLACGPAHVLAKDEMSWMAEATVEIEGCNIEGFNTALRETTEQLERLQERLGAELPEMGSLIFSAHLLMLHDDGFGGEMRRQIENGSHPPAAIVSVARRYIAIFESSKNPYIREKTQDVEDLASRLLENLRPPAERVQRDAWRGSIVVGSEVFPSDILDLANRKAQGLVLVGGGATSHVTILARSLNIPTVIVASRGILKATPEHQLLLDGGSGSLYINPNDETVAQLNERATHHVLPTEGDVSETRTADGERVHIYTTVNLLADLKLARDYHAEGVGLYRTEFSFLMRPEMPSEAEQVAIYRRLVDETPGQRITFRTLDIGGDKMLSFLEDEGHEENPFLGMRSIRVSLRHTDMFRDQIRAILTALRGVDDGRIMFPMISSLDEYRAARAIVEDCAGTLAQELDEAVALPKIGVMIEIPSILEVIDDIAIEADFLCIGTNDFIQYMLAVDRTNERVANYYVPHHPAVLRGIKRVVDAGARHKKEVSLCGEMAREEIYLPFLIGVGLRHLSMDPHYLVGASQFIQSLELADAEAHAETLLASGSVRDVGHALQSRGTPMLAD